MGICASIAEMHCIYIFGLDLRFKIKKSSLNKALVYSCNIVVDVGTCILYIPPYYRNVHGETFGNEKLARRQIENKEGKQKCTIMKCCY